MNISDMVKSLPSTYDRELEDLIIEKVKKLKLKSLTSSLADVLSYAISKKYNNLARIIFEKEYEGNKLDLSAINQSIIGSSESKYSLYHFAAQFGNVELLLYFLDSGLSISVDKDKLSPLHIISSVKNLSKKDFLKIIKAFEKKSPGIINQKDISDLTALHYAAYNNNDPALEALILCGAKR